MRRVNLRAQFARMIHSVYFVVLIICDIVEVQNPRLKDPKK